MTLAQRLGPWVLAFAFTQIVEVPIYLRAIDRRLVSALLVAFGASAITHPVVWFVFPWAFDRWLPTLGYWSMVTAAEIFALVVEAIWLAGVGVRRALVWSLLANGASLGLGLLSRWLVGYP